MNPYRNMILRTSAPTAGAVFAPVMLKSLHRRPPPGLRLSCYTLNRTRKVVPPGPDSTEILALCRAAILWQTANPKPVPLAFVQTPFNLHVMSHLNRFLMIRHFSSYALHSRGLFLDHNQAAKNFCC